MVVSSLSFVIVTEEVKQSPTFPSLSMMDDPCATEREREARLTRARCWWSKKILILFLSSGGVEWKKKISQSSEEGKEEKKRAVPFVFISNGDV